MSKVDLGKDKIICIIGAGWYGCHLGMILKKLGKDFLIFEKGSEIFTQSSYKNQNRLHLGFHYARSYKTRQLCKNGYYKFIRDYGRFIDVLDNNYYIIANESCLDYETYKIIMEHLEVEMEEVECEEVENIQGIINTKECFIENYNIKQYFQKELGDYIITNYEMTLDVLNNVKDRFEYIFNCTNNVLNTDGNFLFEKTLSLIYQKPNPKIWRSWFKCTKLWLNTNLSITF